MSFKKLMQEKGPEMVKAAAKEVEAKNKSHNSLHPKALSKENANILLQRLQEENKITIHVPISKILLEDNIRHQFSPQSIKELADSIKDVGLLHSVVLHLVEKNGEYYFNCVSGKRRILAAESLGLEKIDADITLSKDPVESLYVGAIANLHENVFWLDSSLLYEHLFQHGHSDEQIASRVKVNPRTVGWLKRMAKMSTTCKELARAHQELFTSTWAQQVARHGELPNAEHLEMHMRQMISQKRSWHKVHEELKDRTGSSSVDKSDAVMEIHKTINSYSAGELKNIKKLFDELATSGYLTKSALKKIHAEFFSDVNSNKISS